MAPVPKFERQLPQAKHSILSFPRPNVALVKLNRPKDLNCINMEGHTELDAIWSWMDAEPNLTCGIITGSGRAFSAGADLKGRPVHSIHIHTRTTRNTSSDWICRMEPNQHLRHSPQNPRIRFRRALPPHRSKACKVLLDLRQNAVPDLADSTHCSLGDRSCERYLLRRRLRSHH